jgi:hypothetical protein
MYFVGEWKAGAPATAMAEVARDPHNTIGASPCSAQHGAKIIAPLLS